MREIELKLSAAADDHARLEQALLGMVGAAAPRYAVLDSTYYDTSDLALRRRGMLLRVRRDGERFVQTVKSTADVDGGGMLTRGEWEDAVAGERPELAAPSAARLQGLASEASLVPLFTTAVRRTAVAIEPRPGTRIEAALDTGEIRATDGAATPIGEVELELHRGAPAMLYDIALQLLDAAPLRIEMRSKAERGYGLIADAAAPAVTHVRAPALRPDMTLEALLQAMGRRCLAALLANEAACLAGLPEGVHQMRVAARRLRSLLAAVQAMLPAADYRWAVDELEWIAGLLAPPRNWDVFHASLVRPVCEALPAEAALPALAEAAAGRRHAAYDGAREAIASPRYTRGVLRLCRWFEGCGWRDQQVSEASAQLLEPVAAVAPKLIARQYRRARRRSTGFAGLASPQRHRLRIAAKNLRYGIESFEPLFAADAARRFLKRLRLLQDKLGHANDVHVAAELLAELRNAGDGAALAHAGGLVLGWHARGLADGERRLRRAVRRFRRLEPFW